MHWITVSDEQAKKHALYGVRGWLLIFCILNAIGAVGFALLFYRIVAISIPENVGIAQLAGLTSFAFSCVFIIGIFKRWQWVYWWIVASYVIQIAVMGFLIFVNFKSGFMIPLWFAVVNLACLTYFLRSRRVAINFFRRLHISEVNTGETTTTVSINNIDDNVHSSEAAQFAIGTALPLNSGNSTHQGHDPRSGTQDKKLLLLMEYSEIIRDQYGRLNSLPQQFRDEFSRRIVASENPNADAIAVVDEILAAFDKQQNPYADPAANQRLQQLRRKWGGSAANEFQTVMAAFGEGADAESIFLKIDTELTSKKAAIEMKEREEAARRVQEEKRQKEQMEVRAAFYDALDKKTAFLLYALLAIAIVLTAIVLFVNDVGWQKSSSDVSVTTVEGTRVGAARDPSAGDGASPKQSLPNYSGMWLDEFLLQPAIQPKFLKFMNEKDLMTLRGQISISQERSERHRWWTGVENDSGVWLSSGCFVDGCDKGQFAIAVDDERAYVMITSAYGIRAYAEDVTRIPKPIQSWFIKLSDKAVGVDEVRTPEIQVVVFLVPYDPNLGLSKALSEDARLNIMSSINGTVQTHGVNRLGPIQIFAPSKGEVTGEGLSKTSEWKIWVGSEVDRIPFESKASPSMFVIPSSNVLVTYEPFEDPDITSAIDRIRVYASHYRRNLKQVYWIKKTTDEETNRTAVYALLLD